MTIEVLVCMMEAVIERLEDELSEVTRERDQYKALLEELNSRIFPGSIDTADSLVLMKQERNQAKTHLGDAHLEIGKLKGRVAKLREYIQSQTNDIEGVWARRILAADDEIEKKNS